MKSIKTLSLGLLTSLATMASLSAQTFVYLDANDSNSTNLASVANNTDGLFGLRAFGNESTIYQALSEDAAEVVTTITGLTPGATYTVHVNFWEATGNNWTIGAGFTSGAQTFFSEAGGTLSGTATVAGVLTSTLDYSNSVLTSEDNRTLISGVLGDTVADGSGEIAVFIDNITGAANANRAFFDGVSFAQVSTIPEPSTYALFGGFLTFALVCLRKRLR